jgi:beta-mannosidase
VSYGWDWHPRLITRGIWDETYLDIRNNTAISLAWVDYTLNKNLDAATASLKLEGVNLKDSKIKWTLRDPSGAVVGTKEEILTNGGSASKMQLSNIKLWWPNGYGKPELYTSTVELFNKENQLLQKEERKVGFRQIKMVMGEGTWIEPVLFPKSRSTAPATFEVNGKVIFAKGSNWVQPELFPGQITKETYVPYIKLAKDAHFNMLRAWGGGFVNKESFFDLCDENGLLVWQEFPLTGMIYPDDSTYLAVLKQESTSIIKRVRPHACLALWCGGNELFNEWSGMTEQSWPLRLLGAQCYEMDPKTPFIYTSPLFGMGHGNYVLYDPKNGGEVFQWMPKSKNTAYPEFGVPGTANLDVLKSFIPANELFPPKLGTTWETHHAFMVWGQHRWLELPFLEEYFGKITNIEDLVSYSQLTQCEGYKCIFEESRRQKPYCGMALNWCFQEPWPCAANNSLINWPAKPKPAYYHVAKACRPVLTSARFPKFRWDQGETFTCELFMMNDTYEKLSPMPVHVKLVYDDNQEISMLKWDFPGSPENENYSGPTARVPLPKMKKNLFKVVIEVPGKPEYTSEYTFIYRGKDVGSAKVKQGYLNGVTD